MHDVTPLPQTGTKPALSWSSVLPALNGILFPASCFECGVFSGFEHGLPVCETHLSALERRFTPLSFPGIGSAFAILRYRGLSKKLVQRFKIGGDQHLLSLVRRLVTDHAATEAPTDAYDAIIPVPTRWPDLIGNRWNASERFATVVSERFRAPLRRLLRLTRPMRKQTSLSRAARAQNAAGAFAAHSSTGRYRSLLLVDDVVTTGATSRACAAALLNQGSQRVDLLALAGPP